MPGLVGIISKSSNGNKISRDSMVIPLMEYDWYRTDEFSHDYFSIMHVYTNILSEQQFVFQGDVCACMHGEVYNKDLKNKKQTEYIINLYKEYGKMFPKYLNGSFAIFLYDGKKGNIYLITDRVASKPVFYYSDNERFIFAPELKCILRDRKAMLSVSKHAIAEVLSSQFIPSNKTLIEEILCLEPASILEIRKGELSVEKYWRYTIDEDAEDLSFDYCKEKLSQLLQNAVDIRLRSNHRYGLSLSGGNDSKMLLGCCKSYVDKVKAFSYGNYKNSKTDGGAAERLVKIVGMEHFFYPYSYKDHIDNQLAFINKLDGMDRCQGLADTVPTWKKVREDHGIQILLCGDNLFGDLYGHYDFDRGEEYMFKSLSIHFLQRVKQFRPLLQAGLFELLVQLSKENMNELSQKCKLQDIRARREYFHLEATTFRYYAPWRYAISTEMEIRNPWYDSEILDFLRTIPFNYRNDKSLFKKMGSVMFPELFQGENAWNHAQIGGLKQLYSIKKHKRHISDLLLAGMYPIDEIFNKNKIEELLSDRKLNYLIIKSLCTTIARFMIARLPANLKEKVKKLRRKLCDKEPKTPSTALDQRLPLEQLIIRLLKLRIILKKANLMLCHRSSGDVLLPRKQELIS